MQRTYQDWREARGNKQANVEVDPLLWERLREYAAVKGQPVRVMVALALIEYLQKRGQMEGLEYLATTANSIE